MQSLRKCIQGVTSACAASVFGQPLNAVLPRSFLPAVSIHTSPRSDKKQDNQNKPKPFLQHNKKMYPVQAPEEERRPAFVCHMKSNFKYSPKKMWYISCLVRGMTVDEAIKQLKFIDKKGAVLAMDTILEAQKLAIERHNVEFKSNLWVAESFSTKGVVVKGVRRHGRMRTGEVRYMHCHYFVRLEEGKPPENYYQSVPKNKDEHIESWLHHMRSRKVYNSL